MSPEEGGENIPWKLDPSGVKVVCDCSFSPLACYSEESLLVVTLQFLLPILSADEEEAAVGSNLKIGNEVYFPFLATYFITTKI